jgi:hypothetical protein
VTKQLGEKFKAGICGLSETVADKLKQEMWIYKHAKEIGAVYEENKN